MCIRDSYYALLDRLTDALAEDEARDEARTLQNSVVDSMKRRNILESVITAAERKLRRLEG